MLEKYNNKVVENEYTYTIYVGYKEETNEYGSYDSYEVAYFDVSKVNNSLSDLKVNPEFQGKGIANELMKLVKELGVDNLLAEAFGDGMSQKDLINFYKKHGFTEVASNGNSTFMELAQKQ